MKHTTTTVLLAGSALAGAASVSFPRAIAGGRVRAEADTNPAVVLAELNHTFAEFKTANDARLREIEARGAADPITTQKVEAMNTKMGELQAALDQANTDLAALKVGGGPGGAVGDTPEAREHRKAFASFMAGKMGPQGERAGEIQARGTTFSDPDGGFLVPPQVESGITRILMQTVAMRRLAQVMPSGNASYVKYKSLGGATAGWVGETDLGDGPRGETATPKLARMEFTPGETYAEPATTQQFLDDAVGDVEGWYNNELGITFAEQEGAAFIVGNGVKKPMGFLSYGQVANAQYAWGKVGYTKSGNANGFAALDVADGISQADAFLDLIYSLRAGYRNGASFLTSDVTAGTMRKFKDGFGNYLWQPSVTAGQPSLFLGYPVETDDNMPAVAAGACPVAFANWQQFYLIIDRMGVRTLRNPYKVNGLVLFYSTKRVGGGIQNFEAGKVMKISA